jgi:hypothetical protein
VESGSIATVRATFRAQPSGRGIGMVLLAGDDHDRGPAPGTFQLYQPDLGHLGCLPKGKNNLI